MCITELPCPLTAALIDIQVSDYSQRIKSSIQSSSLSNFLLQCKWPRSPAPENGLLPGTCSSVSCTPTLLGDWDEGQETGREGEKMGQRPFLASRGKVASLDITLWLLGLPYGRYPNTDFLIRAYVDVSKVPLGTSYFPGAAICFNSCQLTGVCHAGPLSCRDIS